MPSGEIVTVPTVIRAHRAGRRPRRRHPGLFPRRGGPVERRRRPTRADPRHRRLSGRCPLPRRRCRLQRHRRHRFPRSHPRQLRLLFQRCRHSQHCCLPPPSRRCLNSNPRVTPPSTSYPNRCLIFVVGISTESPILEALNPRQREAVEQTDGPLLILAGPGSGKTRVIAHRVGYLVRDKNVRPRRILAVTFTNKAAREMRDRVFTLVGEDLGRDITLGTFHAVCSRILRIDGEQIGVPRNFTIYDDSDQIAAVKRALEDQGVDPRRIPPRAVLSAISRAKSELQGPREFAAIVADYFQEVTSRVFLRYQDLLEQNEALDFDDILVKTVNLFQEREDVLEKYAERYLYVHIDEFQDTNISQYVLGKQLASKHRNICVVGDPDQSIYSWRSADIRNILNFEHDFPDATVVILDQNYRSTQTILDSAHSVIALNKQRKEKNLWTENGAGSPIVVHEAYDEEDEAVFAAEEIRRLVGARLAAPSLAAPSNDPAPSNTPDPLRNQDIAVMYRTNAQSRPVEEALVRRNIPYRLVGGTRFYERREVKDLLAYLRLLHNPYDSVALMRVINVPHRGIGDRTLAELNRWSRERTLPPYAALQLIADSERDSPEFQSD